MNIISVLTPGEDGKDNDGRSDFRKKVRQQKDSERPFAVGGECEIIKKGGLSLEARLHVIEMAQVEDETTNAAAQHSIPNANSQMNNLLEERKQAISLAQLICSVYYKNDTFGIQ